VLTRELQASHPEEWRSPQEPTGAIRELFLTVVPERDTRIPPGMQADANVAAALVFAIVNVILVIACVNMAGMLLARAVSRRKEIAVRLALGASRFRLIRQLVTESVLLSLIAGAVGGLVTIWALGLVVAFMPPLPEGIRIALDFAPDWRVFAYTIAFSLLTGVLFGLAPALVGSRADVSPGLKDDAGGVTGGYRRSRTRSLLVVAQVALSVLMLISAGLSLRSLSNLRPTALGFSTDSMLVVPVTLDEKYDRQSSQNFYRQLSDRVRALPGVQHVSLVEALQGGFLGKARRGTEVEGYTGADAQSLAIDHAFVGPRYFTNMNVPIVSGRDIDDRDREGTPCVAVINEVFARRYFPNERSPLGKHLAKLTRGPKELCAIVGVINDERFQALEETPQPFFAFSIFQTHRLTMSLLVNTGPAPAAFVEPVAKIVRDLDPMLTVQDIRTLADTFGAALYPFQLLALVLAGCGATALLLATIGVYGIVSYSVAQRTREVGIRVALGAVKTDVLKMIVGQGMTVVAAGLAIGLVLSAGLMQVLGSELLETGFLFGVSATDFATFASVTLLLALVSGLACYLPARRAMRIDPIKALKYE
jgi:predicted permease